MEPNKFTKPAPVPDDMLGTPIRDSAGRITGPRWLRPWGEGGRGQDWKPEVGEDTRDMRDPTLVGRRYLAEKNGEKN